ncbi:MAG: AI-2E family transporter [Alphaproteobacteria bacterium]|nr:AI-2E family transporter [Alphaproteobacteria bacterium]
MRTISLAVAVVAGAVASAFMVAPFLASLTGALVLAILAYPLHQWIERHIGRSGLAATVSVMAVVVLVALPAAFMVERLVHQSIVGANYIQSELKSGIALPRVLHRFPLLAPAIDRLAQQTDLPALITSVVRELSRMGVSVVRDSLVQVIGFVLTFYFLFYFLRDRDEILLRLRGVLPLSESDATFLFRRIADTVEATMYGTLVVSAIQGALGGLMFWILGLPAPVMWGVLMGILSFVPILGSFIIWVPGAFVLLLNGEWESALILLAWGALVVGTIDNLLRPILIGDKLKLHTITAFIAIVGGIIVFGATGFFLGPMIATCTIALASVWRRQESAVEASAQINAGDEPPLF